MTKLGDYVQFQNGYAFKSSEYASSGHYLIRIKNVQQGFIEISDNCYVGISKSSDLNKFELKNGDIVISLTGNVGRIARIKSEHLPAALNQRVAKVETKNEKILNSEYLYYLLRTPEFFEFAINSGKGAAQQNISTSDMSNFSVKIPTLENQLKIVEKINKAFAELDSLEKNLQLKEEKTNHLIQSILNTAFTNTQEFDKKVVKLGDICSLEYGKPLEKNFRTPDGKFSAYGANGPLSRSTKYLVEGPCIIVGRKGSAGEINYVHENVWPLDVTYFVKHDSEKTLLRYIYFALLSLNIKQLVRGVKPGLNRNDAYNLEIPICSISSQEQIVIKLDKAFDEIDLLRNQISTEKEKISSLRQSILSNAFNFEEKAA